MFHFIDSLVFKCSTVALSLMLTLCSYADEKTVVIAGDYWCPINCSQDDPQQGYMIDIARVALAKHGYKLRYVETPWIRALAQARNGSIHAVVGAFKGDAPDFIYTDTPLLKMSPSSLFTRIERDWYYEGVKSLVNLKLGTVRGYDYGEALNQYIEKHKGTGKINPLSGDSVVQRNIKSLLQGRIDVMAESAPVFWYTAKTMKVEKLLRDAGNTSTPMPCHIAFSPKHPEAKAIAKAFSEGVKELYEQGKLQTLGEAYGLPDNLQPH